MKTKLLISIASMLILLGCDPYEHHPDKITYAKNFNRYISKVHPEVDLSDSEDNIYCILQLGNCDPCVAGHFEVIASYHPNPNLRLILSGKVRNPKIQTGLKEFTDEQILHDRKGLAYRYDIGLSKQMIMIHVKEGTVYKYFSPELESTVDIYNYLEEYSSPWVKLDES